MWWPFRKHEHDWFPAGGAREFIPITEVCLKCKASRVVLPYGRCLGGHPIKDHYDYAGREQRVALCSFGQPM